MHSLRVYVSWNIAGEIEDIILLLRGGGIHRLGTVPAYCDMPVTVRIDIKEKVDRVNNTTPHINYKLEQNVLL